MIALAARGRGHALGKPEYMDVIFDAYKSTWISSVMHGFSWLKGNSNVIVSPAH